MYEPKISVIVPIYNVSSYLDKCINSIINQSYHNLEIILINDGSTDESGLLSETYAKRDNRIIVCHQENQGLAMARNRGIAIASGDYIGFIDGDDWIEVNMYKVLLQNIIMYKADISICCENRVDELGKIIPRNSTSETKIDNLYKNMLFEYDDIMKFYLLDEFPNIFKDGVTNKLYKKHIFDNICFPKGKIYEDTYITYLLIDKAKRLIMTYETYYNYLRREDSISQQSFTVKQFDFMEANQLRYDFIKRNYPHLENICRRLYFKTILIIFLKINNYSIVKQYYEQISAIIEKIKKMDIYTCDLPTDQIKALELFRKDIKIGFMGMKYFKAWSGYVP